MNIMLLTNNTDTDITSVFKTELQEIMHSGEVPERLSSMFNVRLSRRTKGAKYEYRLTVDDKPK